MMGMTASIAPQRESVAARSNSAKGETVRPPEKLEARTVVARRTPPPAPLPFAAREKALATNQGRPLNQSTMKAISKAAPQKQSSRVRVVNNKKIKKVKLPVPQR
jgi:acyl-CoA thioesterase